MRLEDLRKERVAQRRRLDRAITAIDQVLDQQPPRRRRSDSATLIGALAPRLRQRLLTLLYDTGSSLEQLRLVSGLPKREVRSLVEGAVDARVTTLDRDPTYWSAQLDDGRSVAELATTNGSSTDRIYRHLRELGVWPRQPESFDVWLAQRTEVRGACLIWTPPLRQSQVVPMAQRAGRSAVVRRLVWENEHGPVDDELYVTATRDCPDPVHCVAAGHSRLLTPHEASLERAAAGRVAHGEEHGNARLSESQALAILHSHESTRALAASFGVSQATVHAIKTGRRWRHLHDDAD